MGEKAWEHHMLHTLESPHYRYDWLYYVHDTVMNPGRQHVGLSLARLPCGLRDMRLHDGSPAHTTDILRSDHIGMASATTRSTANGRVVGAVGRCDMAACRTGLRGIPWIDEGHTNTCPRSRVDDIDVQLNERPALHNGALRRLSPHPRTNVREGFTRTPPLRAAHRPNHACADRVGDSRGNAGFRPRPVFEPPRGQHGALLLEPGSPPPMPISHAVHRLLAIVPARSVPMLVIPRSLPPTSSSAIVSDVSIATGHTQLPCPAHQRQVAFAVSEGEHLPRRRTTHNPHRVSPGKRPERDGRVGDGTREHAIVGGNGGVGAKRAIGLRIQRVRMKRARIPRCADTPKGFRPSWSHNVWSATVPH